MFVPRSPRFRPQWLRPRTPPLPAWLDDDRWVPPGRRAVYARARTGLAVVADLVAPEVVVLPEFLPPGVVDVFEHTDATVRYYPVDRDLTVSVEAVRRLLHGEDSAMVLFVHYFGFADPDFDELVATARDAGSFVVEDAARGLFARDRSGRLLGSRSDAAVFSLHKVLPVPNGALTVVRDLELPPARTTEHERRALAKSVALAGAQLVDRQRVALAGGQLVDRQPRLGTGAPGEDGSERHAHNGQFPPAPSNPGFLSRLGLARCEPAEIRARRRARYADLRAGLLDVAGVEVLSPPDYEGACPYGVVVGVRGDRSSVGATFASLRSRGVPVETFHWPTPFDASEAAAYPDAPALRDATLVFPTHQHLPRRAVPATVEAVESSL